MNEQLCILSSCFLSQMSMNSILEELRVRDWRLLEAMMRR